MNGRIIRDEQNNHSNLPVIGKIKVGEKTEKGYPTSLDYFKASGKYASKFNEVYPGKPNKIQIIFASDDIASVCNEAYELRGKDGRLYGRGNGEVFEIWDSQEKMYQTHTKDLHADIIKKAPKDCRSPKGWQATLTLRFIIPKIKGVMGVWQLTTKGAKSTIPQIIKAYDFVLHHAGTVQMIPFDLEVEKVKSQKPGSKSVFPVINLIPNIDEDNMTTVRNYIEDGGSVMGVRNLLNGDGEAKALNGEVGDLSEELEDEEVELPF